MAFVICQPCIGIKDGACYLVCPTNAIHPIPGELKSSTSPMLYIDPARCNDCGDCVAQCPTNAIFAEADVPEEWADFIYINANFYKKPYHPPHPPAPPPGPPQ